jgi:predicted phosphoribosyltransferase
MLFKDRVDAGKKIGHYLQMKRFHDPVVFALPRGGVTVAREVARILHVPLDVIVSRKIGAPYHSEYGIGALSEDEFPSFNPNILSDYDIHGPEIKAIVESETEELRRRISLYREGRKLESLTGKTVILVDDGIATGVTAAAAGKFLRTLDPLKSILAVPVAPADVGPLVLDQFDEVLSLYSLANFSAVGQWYQEFNQVEDDEVLRILREFHPDQLGTWEATL